MRDLIRGCLYADPPDPSALGDHNQHWDGTAHQPNLSLKSAAVLLPIVEHGDTDCALILTRRTAHLNHHAGQICLPGGRRDSPCERPHLTALREAWEEIGLAADYIEVVGYLDNYITQTGFIITPVVGFVRQGFQLQADYFEVADIFEVPLSTIVEPNNYQPQSRLYQGQLHHYYALDYRQYHIWGATAGILYNFARRIISVRTALGACGGL
jgi:8-oxo-dGTP pyrophosphatase MutT (NUDIX family)